MTNARKKLEPPLKLDMSFENALGRFAHTDPTEDEDSIKRSKQKQLPEIDDPGEPERSKRGSPLSGRSRKPRNG